MGFQKGEGTERLLVSQEALSFMDLVPVLALYYKLIRDSVGRPAPNDAPQLRCSAIC
jgi:hypothetical protein